MKQKTSDIWQYFDEVDDTYAKCKTCDKNYSRKGRTTSSLKGHLKSMHKDKYEEFCKMEEQREIIKQNQLSSTETPSQQVKRQKITDESIKRIQMWNSSHAKAKQMDDLIGEMIALQDLPFNFVEGIGFRRIMQAALPNYQLRGTQFFTDHICDEIYPKIARKIKQMLQQYPKLSFTTDTWSEPCAKVSLLTLKVHGITEDFDRITIVLKICSHFGRHYGDVVKDHFKTMLKEWNIQDKQLHCFIRVDGSDDRARAMHLTKISDVNCTVHQLQLCVLAALEIPEVKKIIVKCRRISRHFYQSQIAQDELVKIQNELLNQPVLGVIKDCVIRWTSTYHMIKRLLEIKDSICLYTNKHNISQIAPEEWLCLSKIVAILNPFEEITRNLSDASISISSVIPLVHVLKHSLQIEKEKSETNLFLKNMIKILIEEIDARFGDLPSNTLYSLATYLDPRYKLKFFNDIIKDQVQSELLRLLTLHYLSPTMATREENDNGTYAPKRPIIKSEPLDNDPCTSSQIYPPMQSIHSNLADMLKDSSDEDEESENDTKSNFMIWKTLINEYNKDSRLQLNEDPLMWWKYNTKFQVFAPIVRTYLSPPPCSVPSERISGGAGANCEPLRDDLNDDKYSKLLFVKHNLPLVKFDY